MHVTSELDSIQVIDADTHVSEPEDLWISRVPSKLADKVPSVGLHPITGRKHWRINDVWLASTGYFAQAGMPDFPLASNGRHLEDADPGSWNPAERLRRMDEYGIHAQVLYPNLIGFEAPLFMELGSQVSILCTQVYNDFMTEFCSEDPERLLPIAMVPFWDVHASLAEIERTHDLGHRGVLFANKYEQIGMPDFTDVHWDPIYSLCQEMDVPINFHVGFASTRDGNHTAEQKIERERNFDGREEARRTSLSIMTNADTIAKLISSGLCDRFPTLKFVSVESGMGYLPYLMDSMDWHWQGFGAHLHFPMLPSEYFRRQCYGTFWFEQSTLSLLEKFPDNFMFETDYPHPTGIAPGPASPARVPSDHIENVFADVPLAVARKALHDNAASVYGLGRSS